MYTNSTVNIHIAGILSLHKDQVYAGVPVRMF